jgi:bacterial/archaeal transporter family-2 protein
MNAATITLLLALLAGALMAVQAPTNALLGKASGSPVVAALISFIVGTLALGAIVAATSGRLFAPELKAVPWYAWLGGFYGAVFVVVAAFGAPKIGVGPLLTAVIGGQLIGAIVLDHYGLLGLTRQPVSLEKIGGVALVLFGAWLVRRG